MSDKKVFYTSVGTFHRLPTLTGMTPPYIFRRYKLPQKVTMYEFFIWHSLSFTLLREHELLESYYKKEEEAGSQSNHSCMHQVQSLIDRGLVIKGEGNTDEEAIYDILKQVKIYRKIDKPDILLDKLLVRFYPEKVPELIKTLLHRTKDEMTVLKRCNYLLSIRFSKLFSCFKRKGKIHDDDKLFPVYRRVLICLVCNLYMKKNLYFG